jgi:hypothetical protein
MGGVGSGKTFILGIRALKYITKFPHMIGLIGANTYQQLTKSTLKRCFDVWKEFGMINGVHYVVDRIPPDNWPKLHVKLKSYDNTICFNNGCVVFIASLDNYKAIDGTEIGWAELDETKDTKEEAVKEVIVARLRQPGMWVTPDGRLVDHDGKDYRSHNPLAIFTSPAKVLWLNEWFRMPEYYEEIAIKIYSKDEYFCKELDGRLFVICSTYHNEINLPSGYIEQLKKDYTGNSHLVDMLIFGSPIAKSGGEFYHQFDRLKHIGPVKYDPFEPIHISFDFNVVPYISAIVSQIKWDDEKNVYVVQTIKEYALEAPRNNSEDLSNAILLDFIKHKSGAFIYGDATGKNRQTVSKEFRHNYEVIEHILKPLLFSESNRVTRRNPALVKRRDFANKMFAEGYDIRLIFDPSCKRLITDFEFVKEAPDGGKLKEMTKDSNTGESYQKLAHHSDCWDYLICSAFEDYFN